MGLRDKAFRTSGWALEGPGPNKSLDGTEVLARWGKFSSFKFVSSFVSVKTF